MCRDSIHSNSKIALSYLMPRPDLVVGALADLGLSDDQIGQYFGVDEEDIAEIPHVAMGKSGYPDLPAPGLTSDSRSDPEVPFGKMRRPVAAV